MGLAVVSALLAACCFAAAAHLQHAGIRASTSRQRVDLRALGRVVRSRRWLAGALMAAIGSGLHVAALAMGPLIVVQPLGVLSLVLSVLVGVRSATAGRAMIAAGVIAACGGTVGFVAVAAAAHGAQSDTPDIGRVQVAVLVPLLLAGLAWMTHGRARCVILATGAAMWLGLGSALISAGTRWVRDSEPTTAVLALGLEIVVLMVAGAWLVTQAYASGPPSLVLGIATVVDPFAAVSVGIGVYGELTDAGPALVLSLAGSGFAAVVGVAVLARVLPETRSREPVPRDPARPRNGDRLRILLSTDSFPPDVNGAARFTERLALALATRGHEVHVVCPARSGTPEYTSITVHGVSSIRAPFHPTVRICLPWPTIRTVSALLTGLRPDIVHVQAHGSVGRVVVSKARAHGVPVVATNHFMPDNLFGYLPLPRFLHGAVTRFAYRDLLRVYRRTQVVTAPTRRAADLLHARGLAPVRVVSCGIDLDRFAPRKAESPERAESSYARPPATLFVGRLDVEKHVDVLIRALAAAAERVEIRAEIVGDGMCREQLQTLAGELGVADAVRFHGFVSDTELVEIYGRCDMFCLPGTAELQSIATMEAMASGLPVLAANAMALPHLVRDGVNGYLFAPGDVDGLANRLVELCADGDLRQSMGRASRTIVADHDVSSTVSTFEEIYRGAIGTAAWRTEVPG